MDRVLPLRGLWRAGLISRKLFTALREAGVEELPQLCTWTSCALRARTGILPAEVAALEDLMARYCLGFKVEPRRRFRRPGRRLDPY